MIDGSILKPLKDVAAAKEPVALMLVPVPVPGLTSVFKSLMKPALCSVDVDSMEEVEPLDAEVRVNTPDEKSLRVKDPNFRDAYTG